MIPRSDPTDGLDVSRADLAHAVEIVAGIIGKASIRRQPALRRCGVPSMIALVSIAWKMLAPLGVETADIRRHVDKAVRNAWK